jgi:hypothetical protein
MSKEEKEQFRFAAEMAVNTIISNSKWSKWKNE